jgi:hypothetical protein
MATRDSGREPGSTSRTARSRATSRPQQRRGGSPPRTRSSTARASDNGRHLTLPLLGEVPLPANDQLVFLVGVGALAVTGVVDWPVAVAVGTGHLLVKNRRSTALRELGDALEEA